ncbi:MAG: T9SS type A sorting domain-containing protein [Bacteroidota bacterium]|nr:MAG: T9SS type A sorting domain-containing protein [Bacteroidota bacterium]
MYPNPTQQNLTIEGDGLETFKLSDMLGREVLTKQLDAQNDTQKLNYLP